MNHENDKNERTWGRLSWSLSAAMLISLGAGTAWADKPASDCNCAEEDDENHYGESGSFELGGSLGFSWNEGRVNFTASPNFGYFLVDHFELSLITTGEYTRQVTEDAVSQSGFLAMLVEPSYHFPLSERLLVFGGLGVGGGWATAGIGGRGPGLRETSGWAFDLVPRAGLNLLFGKSALFTPAVAAPIAFNGDGVRGGFRVEVGVGTTW